ncbi:MAG: hypothetical protein K8R17_11860 [Methanosarcinales archaeon]|nr:hypothetical protein [Methanosarcinales archaeon]
MAGGAERIGAGFLHKLYILTAISTLGSTHHYPRLPPVALCNRTHDRGRGGCTTPRSLLEVGGIVSGDG